MDVRRARRHRRLIAAAGAIACALAGVAEARPPSFAKARKVAAAWLRAARRVRVPPSSSPDLEVAIDGIECHGVYQHERLADGVDCIARTFARHRLGHWSTFLVAGDERDVRLDADGGEFGDLGDVGILIKVNDRGQVTDVRVGP